MSEGTERMVVHADGRYSIRMPPEYVGHWACPDGWQFAALSKPNVWQRFWYRTLLGWRWVDSAQPPRQEVA